MGPRASELNNIFLMFGIVNVHLKQNAHYISKSMQSSTHCKSVAYDKCNCRVTHGGTAPRPLAAHNSSRRSAAVM